MILASASRSTWARTRPVTSTVASARSTARGRIQADHLGERAFQRLPEPSTAVGKALCDARVRPPAGHAGGQPQGSERSRDERPYGRGRQVCDGHAGAERDVHGIAEVHLAALPLVGVHMASIQRARSAALIPGG